MVEENEIKIIINNKLIIIKIIIKIYKKIFKISKSPHTNANFKLNNYIYKCGRKINII